MVFVDDDSDTVHSKNALDLQCKLQSEVDNSVNWLADNKLCTAPDKTKFMIIGTSKLKKIRQDIDFRINIDNQHIAESQSEKVLGVVLNNEMLFRNHLYGNEDNDGLTTDQKRRVGIMHRLSKTMSNDKLKLLSHGIFYSKLNYCLPVFGTVFGLAKYKDKGTRYINFTTRYNNNLQTLQNKLNRILTNSKMRTPTRELLENKGPFSVQQMIALQTL